MAILTGKEIDIPRLRNDINFEASECMRIKKELKALGGRATWGDWLKLRDHRHFVTRLCMVAAHRRNKIHRKLYTQQDQLAEIGDLLDQYLIIQINPDEENLKVNTAPVIAIKEVPKLSMWQRIAKSAKAFFKG